METYRSLNEPPKLVIAAQTVNVVAVSINAVSQDGGNPTDGHIRFQVDDIVWIDALNLIASIDPVDIYAAGGLASSGVVHLLAMDNPGVSTNWAWVISGESNGQEFPPRKLIVNYANGAEQTLCSLLDTSVPL